MKQNNLAFASLAWRGEIPRSASRFSLGFAWMAFQQMFCGYECCPNKLASSLLHRWHLGFVLDGNFILFCLFTFLSVFR